MFPESIQTATEEDQLVYLGDLPSNGLFANLLIHKPAPLNAKLTTLMAYIGSAFDSAPSKPAAEMFGELSGQVDSNLGRLQEVIDKDLDLFNNLISELELPAVAAKPSS